MVRISKDPEERKNEIMDAAQELFVMKGYEDTAVSDIVKKVGVAQGLFYYYFKSKDEILDAVLDRFTQAVMESVQHIATDKSLSEPQKIQAIMDKFLSLGASSGGLVDYIHRKENLNMHKKISERVVKQFVPMIIEIVKQGIQEGVFDTHYPEEAVEFLLLGLESYHEVFNFFTKDRELARQKFGALADIIERVLGSEKGSFNFYNTVWGG